VIIICREKCLNLRKYENLEWSIEDWNMIVEEKHLANWIVRISDNNTVNRAIQVSTDMIAQYEEAKKINSNISIDGFMKLT